MVDSILGSGNKLASKLNRKMDRETTYTKCDFCGRTIQKGKPCRCKYGSVFG